MRMAPLQWLLLGFRSVVETPYFVSSHNGVQKLPVRSAWETSARNPSVSFCGRPLTFWAATLIFCHNVWNCGLRHFGNDVMQLSYRHESIYASLSFSFLKKFARDQRWPTAPLFVVNIILSFAQFTAPLRHTFPIHNVTINSNNLFVNFRWTFTFCVEKWRNAPRIWRDFGSALPFKTRLTQTKPILPLSNENGSEVKDQGRQQCCHNNHKKFPYRLPRDVSLLSGHFSYLRPS
jgi:hypothetical protein